MYQLRLNLKQPESTAPGSVHWAIVRIEPGNYGPDRVSTVIAGGGDDLQNVAEEGASALQRILTTPVGPVRAEFDCSCGALLAIEARRSRKSPYSWDSPRELMCSCGRVYGVKLQFAAGTDTPHLEAFYRYVGGPPLDNTPF